MGYLESESIMLILGSGSTTPSLLTVLAARVLNNLVLAGLRRNLTSMKRQKVGHGKLTQVTTMLVLEITLKPLLSVSPRNTSITIILGQEPIHLTRIHLTRNKGRFQWKSGKAISLRLLNKHLPTLNLASMNAL